MQHNRPPLKLQHLALGKFNSYQTFVILIAVFLGLLIGQYQFFSEHAGKLIIPFLMAMLFGLFLSISLKNLKTSFFNFRFSITSLTFNFIWTPIFSYCLGLLFLSHHQALWIGFVMLMVTPCTDWYLVFTGVAKGNVALSTAILPINLVLQVLFLPVYLLLFFNKSGSFDLMTLLQSMLFVLVIPFLFALALKYFSKGGADCSGNWFLSFFARSQILFLALAVVAMFASEGKALLNNPSIIYALLTPIVIFFAVTFFLGKAIGKMLGFSYEDTVSLSMTTLARNSPIALAIAMTAFPAEPLVALALVIGPLIELPILVVISQLLLKMRNA